jgi:hypothetical protein
MERYALTYSADESHQTVLFEKNFPEGATLEGVMQLFADFLVASGFTYVTNVGCVDTEGKETWGPY